MNYKELIKAAYNGKIIPGYRARAEAAEAKLARYTASGLEPCDYAAMRSALDGEAEARRALGSAARLLAAAEARAEKAERERDAAVKDLMGCAIESRAECMYCLYKTARAFCWDCTDGSNWQWRGPQEG